MFRGSRTGGATPTGDAPDVAPVVARTDAGNDSTVTIASCHKGFRLDNVLRREVLAGGKAYIVTLTPLGLKVAAKGRRNGIALTWDALVDGEAALAVALNASLHRLPAPTPRRTRAARASRR